MKLFTYIGLLLKAKKVVGEIEDKGRKGTMGASLKGIGHILALSAPAIGAALLEAVAKALGSSHDTVALAIGSLLGALIPLLRQSPVSK